jgi:hypothetical protein
MSDHLQIQPTMKITKLFIVLFSIFLNTTLKAQLKKPIKKDTIYYLVDTAKTPRLDRVFGIEHSKQFVFYNIYCPCYAVKWKPQFYYVFKGTSNYNANLKPVYTTKSKMEKLSFVTLNKLITLSCSEGTNVNSRHNIFFIEHLPNDQYLVREVKSNAPPAVDELH